MSSEHFEEHTANMWTLYMQPSDEGRLTRGFVELLVELRQLRACRHHGLPHHEGGHHCHHALAVPMVQGKLDECLVQEHALGLQEVPPPPCKSDEESSSAEGCEEMTDWAIFETWQHQEGGGGF